MRKAVLGLAAAFVLGICAPRADGHGVVGQRIVHRAIHHRRREPEERVRDRAARVARLARGSRPERRIRPGKEACRSSQLDARLSVAPHRARSLRRAERERLRQPRDHAEVCVLRGSGSRIDRVVRRRIHGPDRQRGCRGRKGLGVQAVLPLRERIRRPPRIPPVSAAVRRPGRLRTGGVHWAGNGDHVRSQHLSRIQHPVPPSGGHGISASAGRSTT